MVGSFALGFSEARALFFGLDIGRKRAEFRVWAGRGLGIEGINGGCEGYWGRASLRGLGVGMKTRRKLCGDEVGPVLFGATDACLGFEVAFDEGVEQVVGDEEKQRACQ